MQTRLAPIRCPETVESATIAGWAIIPAFLKAGYGRIALPFQKRIVRAVS
jgi:hypothetical protein